MRRLVLLLVAQRRQKRHRGLALPDRLDQPAFLRLNGRQLLVQESTPLTSSRRRWRARPTAALTPV